jgi:V/A-type H+-transporting ATPase subunit E
MANRGKSRQKKNAPSFAGSALAYDENKKLLELQTMVLQKGDEARERILSEARAEAAKWTEEKTKELGVMVSSIRADAAKRCDDISRRQISEAETKRDKDRLRFQSGLVDRALMDLQNALVAFENRHDYDAILTGLAAEICCTLSKGQRVTLRLRKEDSSHGQSIAHALMTRFPGIEVAFDATPAAIIGGVYIYSEEEKWHVSADWKSKVGEMADEVARAVLSEL